MYTHAREPWAGIQQKKWDFQTVLRPGTAAAGAGMESDGASMDAGALPESLSATSAEDTRKLAEWLLSEQVDLILFAGGDGTARDVYQAVELSSPCVGIPAGVKIHSPVYAKNPRAAGRLALLWLSGKLSMTQEEEVLDIDEEQYRKEHINTRLYGYLRVPRERTLTQNKKAPSPYRMRRPWNPLLMRPLGRWSRIPIISLGPEPPPGIMEVLGLKNTLIGVDLIRNKELVANDLGGKELLSYIKGKRAKMIVTITGGQGYLFWPRKPAADAGGDPGSGKRKYHHSGHKNKAGFPFRETASGGYL